MLKQIIFLVLIVSTIVSCSTKRHINVQNTNKAIHKETRVKTKIQKKKKRVSSTHNINSKKSKKKTNIKYKLETHYNKYKTIPYKYGGTSTKGFDCSGFVQFTYKDVLNIRLPRTTRLMLKEGSAIKKTQLKIGDLVLFKTSKRYRHVGIFMGDNLFMHVSTKKGVMKSNLNNPYWLKHYLTSRRIF